MSVETTNHQYHCYPVSPPSSPPRPHVYRTQARIQTESVYLKYLKLESHTNKPFHKIFLFGLEGQLQIQSLVTSPNSLLAQEKNQELILGSSSPSLLLFLYFLWGGEVSQAGLELTILPSLPKCQDCTHVSPCLDPFFFLFF